MDLDEQKLPNSRAIIQRLSKNMKFITLKSNLLGIKETENTMKDDSKKSITVLSNVPGT